MIKLDLEYLDDKGILEYNSLAKELIPEFNLLIGDLYNKQNENRAWYFSSIASRNPCQSELFERCCKLIYALNWCKSQDSNTEILTSDYVLYKKLKRLNSLSKHRIVCKNKSFSILKGYIYPIICLLRNIFILSQRYILKFFARHKVMMKEKKLILLEVFCFSGSSGGGRFSSNGYNDRYYPNYLNLTDKILRNRFVYTPTFYGIYNYIPLLMSINKVNNFVWPDKYLRLRDFINIALIQLKRIYLPKNIKIRNVDIIEFIKSELIYRKFDWSKLSAELNYKYILSLRRENVKISAVIDWYENQVVDRGLISSIKKYYKNISIIGYQGFIICSTKHFYLKPEFYEIKRNLAPSKIAVISKAVKKDFESNIIDIPIISAPAFRFQYLWDKREKYPNNENIIILVALPILVKNSIEIIKNIINASNQLKNNNKKIIFWIKMHPSHTNSFEKKIGYMFNSDRVFVIKGELKNYLDQSHIFASNSTSVCVEALTKSLEVVIICNKNGLTENPIPNSVSKINYKICHNADYFVSIIRNYNMKFVENNLNINNLFNPIDKYSVCNFNKELS